MPRTHWLLIFIPAIYCTNINILMNCNFFSDDICFYFVNSIDFQMFFNESIFEAICEEALLNLVQILLPIKFEYLILYGTHQLTSKVMIILLFFMFILT